jgi:hypothetical protein
MSPRWGSTPRLTDCRQKQFDFDFKFYRLNPISSVFSASGVEIVLPRTNPDFVETAVSKVYPYIISRFRPYGSNVVTCAIGVTKIVGFPTILYYCSTGSFNSTVLTVCVQWLRLALSKGPNRVDVPPPSPEDRNRFTFRNVVFSSF